MLKKLSMTLFAALFLVACSANDNVDKNEVKEEGNEGVEVDKGLLSTTLSIPTSLLFFDEDFTEEDLEDMKAEIEAEGAKDVKLEGDYITYKISNKDHKAMMKEMHKNVLETFDEFLEDDDIQSFREIEANNNFSQIELIVDQEIFENSLDGFALLGIGLSSMIYQVFDGEDPDKVDVKVDLIDQASGEVFDEFSMRESLEAMEESLEE